MNGVGPILHGACALVLLAAAVAHLRRPADQRRALATHNVLPRVLHWPATFGLLTAELVLGASLLLAQLRGELALARWAGAGAAVLFVLFAGYLAVVWRTRAAQGIGAVPCACGVGETEVGGWVVARAAGFALMAAAGAAAAETAPLTGRPLPELVVVVAAALTFAIGLTGLPVARRVPDDLTLVTVPAGQGR